MFDELKRPVRVFKRDIISKLNIFSSFKGLSSEIKGTGKSSSPVASDVSKSEYKRRYKGLCIHSSITLFFLCYSILFVVFSLNLISFLASFAVFIFLFISYAKAIHRAWLARFYYKNWEKRSEHQDLRFRDFVDSISLNKRILLPIYDIKFKG